MSTYVYNLLHPTTPRLPASTPLYALLKLFQTGRSHMVLLTQPELEQEDADHNSVNNHHDDSAPTAGSGMGVGVGGPLHGGWNSTPVQHASAYLSLSARLSVSVRGNASALAVMCCIICMKVHL
jgi:hypothetical protein